MCALSLLGDLLRQFDMDGCHCRQPTRGQRGDHRDVALETDVQTLPYHGTPWSSRDPPWYATSEHGEAGVFRPGI